MSYVFVVIVALCALSLAFFLARKLPTNARVKAVERFLQVSILLTLSPIYATTDVWQSARHPQHAFLSELNADGGNRELLVKCPALQPIQAPILLVS